MPNNRTSNRNMRPSTSHTECTQDGDDWVKVGYDYGGYGGSRELEWTVVAVMDYTAAQQHSHLGVVLVHLVNVVDPRLT